MFKFEPQLRTSSFVTWSTALYLKISPTGKKSPQLSAKSAALEVFLHQIVGHLQTFDQSFFPLKNLNQLSFDIDLPPTSLLGVTAIFWRNCPFPSENAFGTLCLTRKGWLLGWAQSNALNISEVHHFKSCSYFLHRIYILLILLTRPAGLSMATFGKVPLPAPSLCPAHPPPRSGELFFCQTSLEDMRSKRTTLRNSCNSAK